MGVKVCEYACARLWRCLRVGVPPRVPAWVQHMCTCVWCVRLCMSHVHVCEMRLCAESCGRERQLGLSQWQSS